MTGHSLLGNFKVFDFRGALSYFDTLTRSGFYGFGGFCENGLE